LAQQAPGPVADDLVDSYLADHQLLEVLAARLRVRVTQGSAEDRARTAELLGKLYVRMLAQASTPEARQAIEEKARELLKIPEADSFELRIDLAKATYLRVEEIVEKDRLHLAGPEERAEADRVLRAVGPIFKEIAGKLDNKVKLLEDKEKSNQAQDIEALRAELADARRLRSLAKYYWGWTEYYTALLNKTPQRCTEAMKAFGGLLNALPGREPTIDRLPKNLLHYEHVARAAIGCALCASMLGKDVEASRWLDEIETAEDLPPVIQDQLFTRRLIISAAAQKWADVDLAVRHRRQPQKGSPPQPLSVADARLLAVLCLEAARDPAVRPGIKEAAEKLAQIGLGDLIIRGEVGHVLDLVSMYGTTPIGQEGFIVNYVRSLQTYEKARAAHKAAGKDDEPATEVAIVNQYREAADLLGAATANADAAQFPKEREKAEVRHGLALYYAGDLEAAATQFQAAANVAATAEQKRDALWYAIVTLDRAVEAGKVSLAADRDKIATLYLQEFPGSDNAAKLLLRQVRADRLNDAQAIDILLKVPKESAIYEASRLRVSSMLYAAYRRASGSEKDFAAIRFADVAEGVLKLEQARAMAGVDDAAKAAAGHVQLLVRQIADALLAASSPDVQRVEAALSALDTVAAFQAMDIKELKPELTFRRMQIAVAKGDEAAVVKLTDQLRAIGGPFADASDRLLYKRAQKAFKATPADVMLAKQVVRYGSRVLDTAPAGTEKDAGIVATRDSVAQAAGAIWLAEKDRQMLDLAIKLDRTQIDTGNRTASSLRRLGELIEARGGEGDTKLALAAWRELLSGLPNASPEWYEARYESLRLLSLTDPAEAAQVMTQHKVLHPDYGPEPWGRKLADLEAKIGVQAPPPAPTSPAQPKSGGSGPGSSGGSAGSGGGK
jgi:hypothetical protein